MTQKPDFGAARYADKERNIILNRALADLENIITQHDPEHDTSINNLVWERLDQMAVDIEAHAVASSPSMESVVFDARSLLSRVGDD